MISFRQFLEGYTKSGDDYFDEKALNNAKSPNYDSTARRPGYNPQYDKLIHIHPKDFLSVVRKGFDPIKADKVSSLMNSNTKFSDLPELYFKHNGNGEARVSGHEGRHRAMALIDKGASSMPVVLRQSYNGDTPPIDWKNHFEGEFPTTLHGEISTYAEKDSNAKNSIKFPTDDPRVK